MIRFLLMATTLLLLACTRKETVETWPEGQRKLVREYAWPEAKDSLHLHRETAYYSNGKIESETPYRNGLVHGEFKVWWENGQLKAKGYYRQGKPHGPWEYYFNTYVLAAKGSFKDGLKEALWIEYWENGELKRRGSYRGGKEIGEWLGWVSAGGEVLRTSCFESNASGHTKSAYDNGSFKEEFDCRFGKRVGPYVEGSPEGTPLCRGFYDTTGAQDSLWQWFHTNGRLSMKQHFLHGLRNDSLLGWDSSGRVIERGFFKLGTGAWNRYDTPGHVLEIKTYEDGLPLSIKRWHPNHSLAAQGAYAQGKKTGTWKIWDAHGLLKESAQYENGELNGERRFFDSTGTLTRIQEYYKGMPTKGFFPKH